MVGEGFGGRWRSVKVFAPFRESSHDWEEFTSCMSQFRSMSFRDSDTKATGSQGASWNWESTAPVAKPELSVSTWKNGRHREEWQGWDERQRIHEERRASFSVEDQTRVQSGDRKFVFASSHSRLLGSIFIETPRTLEPHLATHLLLLFTY